MENSSPLTVLEEDSKYLWEHGETRRTSSNAKESAQAKAGRIAGCKEHALHAFYSLGKLTPMMVRTPGIWRHIFYILLSSASNDDAVKNYYSDDALKKTEELRDKIQGLYSVYALTDRLLALLISLFFFGLGAFIFFSQTEAMSGAFYDILVILCLVAMVAGFFIGGIVGVIAGFFLTALAGWLIMTLPALRVVLSVICALPGLLFLLEGLSKTKGSARRKLRKQETQEEFLALREEAAALVRKIRPCLDALEEFRSERCSHKTYQTICADITHVVEHSTKVDGVKTVDSTESVSLTLEDARQYASRLIRHYSYYLDNLQKTVEGMEQRFAQARVELP